MRRRGRHPVPAVVVGGGLNGLGVVRSLGSAGVPVIVVGTHAGEPAMRSRYAHRRSRVYDSRVPGALLDTLEQLADSLPAERPVLILTQEEAVAIVAAHRARLQARYRLTTASADIVRRLLHKDGFRALADAAGARVPQTRRLQAIDELAGLDNLRLPWVIKPALRDAAYSKTFAKAYRIDDRDAAHRLLRRILAVLPDVIVQEWIEGGDAALYFCLAYIPPCRRAPTTFVGRKIRSWPPRVGGTASCAPAPEAASLARTTIDFFRRIGVKGLASIEYKRDARSGAYLMVEPTVGRTDYQQEVATLNGVNIVLAAYRDVLDLAPLPCTLTTRMRVWRDRVSDRRSAAAQPANGQAMPAPARIVDALWRASDPMPAAVPLYARLQSRLVRAAGRARATQSGGHTT